MEREAWLDGLHGILTWSEDTAGGFPPLAQMDPPAIRADAVPMLGIRVTVQVVHRGTKGSNREQPLTLPSRMMT